jgi:hypothetical protein
MTIYVPMKAVLTDRPFSDPANPAREAVRELPT